MFIMISSVAIGGAIGASLRFLSTYYIAAIWGNLFPYGTMAVNVIGSIIMGILFVIFTEKLKLVDGEFEHLRGLLMTGLLGGFTTFSAFSLDAMQLIERQAYQSAFVYIILSVLLSISGLILAIYLTRSLS
ncbi:MAG: fluoride efflux transporter CrcB [Rhizobiales bacterium]|nr:fluoride efflux transporter CrcB [Hyphomicrobiales bacterium]